MPRTARVPMAHSNPSPIELDRARRRINRLVCSAPWAERCLSELVAKPRFPRRIDQALDEYLLYPPGGAPRRGRRGTLMRRCADCGAIWYPPQYLRVGKLCEDCAAAIGLPLTDEKTHVSSTCSPTAQALRDLAYFHIRLIEPRLAAEDEASLKAQIADFGSRQSSKSSFAPRKKTKKHRMR